MKDPFRRGLVLPLTRREQVAHYRYRSGTPHSLGRLQRRRETEHSMATSHQYLDQLDADESGGSRNEGARRRLVFHEASFECEPGDEPPTTLAQDSYDARTGAAVT
jgi:hypothetical protein